MNLLKILYIFLIKKILIKPYRYLRHFVVSKNQCILFIPGFTNETELNDQFYRLLWYINPILSKTNCQVWIPTFFTPEINPSPPLYMDQSIIEFKSQHYNKIHYFNDNDIDQWKKILRRTTIVICWNKSLAGGINKIGKLPSINLQLTKIWNVDRYNDKYEGSFYIKISHDYNKNRNKNLKCSWEKLNNSLLHLVNNSKTYIFGTGPSLEKAYNFSFDDGISIVCNSIVKNKKLMNHIKPKIIVFGDPIFHAGCSAYAGQFRRSLYSALDNFDCFVFIPFRDYNLLMTNIPNRFKERIIGIPLEHLNTPNLNIRSLFKVMSTSNIITLFSIPLACTISKEIYILGCDGKKIENNKYFWNHHNDSQINEHMETIKQCHPAFFNIDYNDYYYKHCDVLEKMLSYGETQGHNFFNLTQSYIPALITRSIKNDCQ